MNNSLTAHLDVDCLVAEAVLMRNYKHSLSLCLVEGDADFKLLAKFFDSEKCDFILCHGKENATKAFSRLKEQGLEGLLTILDRDFDIIDPQKNSVDMLFWDERDLENYLCSTSALDSIIAEHSSRAKMETLSWNVQDVRVSLRDCAQQIGKLRHIAHREGIPLKFRTISYGFICKTKIECDLREMCNEVSRKSQCGLDGTMIHDLLDKYVPTPETEDCLCHGHDLTTILGIMLRKKIGTLSTNQSDSASIESKLRLALSAEVFAQSSLFARIKDWEARCVPFKIFPV